MEERKLNTRQPKPLEELNVIDDFLFKEIMADEVSGQKVCRMILETVLKRKIGDISFTAQKAVPGVSESKHGIIMDAYITESTDGKGSDVRVFDIEPENKASQKRSLPKRGRYYADLIDVHLLNSGTDYDKLPELVIIFILPYDPFGENAMYYEAGTILKTHPQKEYDDGIRRIYLYTEGELPENASPEDIKLKNLLKYIGNSIKENVTDDETGLLDEIVADTKSREDVGIRYMKSWEWEKEIREEERINTEKERERADTEQKRADTEQKRADKEKNRADTAEAKLAKYVEKYGELE